MNDLIKQLEKSPKWADFDKWYNKKYPFINIGGDVVIFGNFCYSFPYTFQKGVFEEFLKEQGYYISQSNNYNFEIKGLHDIIPLCCDNSFEKLLVWFFNLEKK